MKTKLILAVLLSFAVIQAYSVENQNIFLTSHQNSTTNGNKSDFNHKTEGNERKSDFNRNSGDGHNSEAKNYKEKELSSDSNLNIGESQKSEADQNSGKKQKSDVNLNSVDERKSGINQGSEEKGRKTENNEISAEGVITNLLNMRQEEDNAGSLEDYAELLWSLADEPLNINSATREELEELQFLTPFQIEKLQEYIYDYGELLSPYELLLIEGFGNESLNLCLPFFKFERVAKDDKPSFKKLFSQASHSIMLRADYTLQRKRGYTEGKYQGPPVGGYLKYKLNGRNLVLNFTAEHDAGEPFKGNGGFDFYSASAMIKNIGACKYFAIGDFKLSYGQGLTLNTGSFLSSAFGGESFIKYGGGIKAYTSSTEYGYLRGAATEWKIRRVSIAAFYSRTTCDDGENYHRTASELERKNSFKRNYAGGNVTYAHPKFKLGASGAYCIEEKAFNIGLDYRTRIGSINLAGEAAIDEKWGFGLIQCVDVCPVSWLSYAGNIRYYSGDFRSLLGNAHGENSLTDELGMTSSVTLTPFRNWSFTARFDFFSFSKPRYGIDKPSDGFKFNFTAGFSPNSYTLLNLKYSLTSKEKNVSGSKSDIKESFRYHKHTLKAYYKTSVRSMLELNGGLLCSLYQTDEPLTLGWLFYQNAKLNLCSGKLAISLGMAIFDAAEYNNRLYLYEYSLPHSFASTMYYGSGGRLYMVIRYAPVRFISISLKAAHSYYADGRESVGSSWELTKGCRRSDVKVLVRFLF